MNAEFATRLVVVMMMMMMMMMRRAREAVDAGSQTSRCLMDKRAPGEGT